MIETFVTWLVRLGGAWLMFAGLWLAIHTAFDIGRSGRLMFEHLLHLQCAGSALALGGWLVF